MMRKVVLVDFDGVVLTNARCMKYVHQKATDYVMHVTGIKTRQLAIEYNKQLCSMYGHTCRGLRFDGYDVGLVDFNRFVYSKIPLDLSMTASEYTEWCSFKSECTSLGYDVRLFSNACTTWIEHFIQNEPSHMFEIQELITSTESLKPNAWIYNVISQTYNDSLKVFIDDNLINFTPDTAEWTNVWFSIHDPMYGNVKENVLVCSSLSGVTKKLKDISM